MVRKGRAFEKLISLLEKGLNSDEVLINSPDFLIDKITGENREVDISVRKKIEGKEIIIIFECRDRKSTSDVIWIEQLATKVHDLGVFKIIAVSSSKFSNGAKKKARYYNIELRKIDEITNDQLQGWLIPSGVFITVQHHNIIECTILTDNPTQFKEEMQFDTTKKLFIHHAGNKFSPNDLFNLIPNKNKYLPSISLDSKEKKRIELKFDLRSNGISIQNSSQLMKIDGVILTVDIWNETEFISTTKMGTYSNEENRVAGFSECPIKINDSTFKLLSRTYKNKDNSQRIDLNLIATSNINKKK